MTINQAPLHTKLKVISSSGDQSLEVSDVESRLMHLGFIEGELIKITRKVSFSNGPLLVEVRGRSIALSPSEANLVSVEVSS